MSFPSKYPGVCKACGERINVGDIIAWKPGQAWHDRCDPSGNPVDFSGIERFLKAKLAAFLAAGGTLPEDPGEGVSATAKAAEEVNASMGHYWSKKRGFYGKGFTEPA